MRARFAALVAVAVAVLAAACGDDDDTGPDSTQIYPDSRPLPDGADVPDGAPTPDGDGTPDAPGPLPDAFVADAPPPGVCGNGVLESPEQCDDAGTTSGDGCSATCTLEASSCALAGFLPLPVGATLSGTTSGTSSYQGVCGGGAADEQIYAVTLYSAGDLTVTTDLPGTDFNTALYARGTCDNGATQLSCASTSPLGDTMTLLDLAPGVYWFFVDGVAGATGAFQISASLRAVVPHIVAHA